MSRGASVPDQALAVPVEPASGLAPPGFDPSRFEYRFSIQAGHERHDWIASGEYGAVDIWAEPTARSFRDERWFGGIEGHSKTPAEYQDAGKPSQEVCWLLLAPCWHDGSSLQFSEQVEFRLPSPTGKPISGDTLDELKPLLRSRYRSWLAEPASVMSAGTAATTQIDAGLQPASAAREAGDAR